MKKLTVLFLAMALGAIIGWPSRSTLSQSQVPNVPLQIANVGKVTNSYRKEWPGPRPSWVDVGLSRSTAHLRANQTSLGLANPDAELTLLAADQDDLGMTHVRLDQLWNGVPVFGGQIVVHLDAMDKASLSPLKFNFTTGRVFKDARQVNTNALIPGSSAIALAKADLRYTGTFTNRPEAKLVILPEAVKTDRDVSGAKLAYQIDLSIEDGSDAAGLQRYFVDARDGSIVWHYDAMPRQGSAQGT